MNPLQSSPPGWYLFRLGPDRIDPQKEAKAAISQIPIGPPSYKQAFDADGATLVHVPHFVTVDTCGKLFLHFEVIEAAFSKAIDVVTKHTPDFWDAIYADGCQAYRAEVGRLPGSNRTARLRKKRRTLVMRWYLLERSCG